MICQSCGRANEQGARFCKSCGAPLESNVNVQQNNTTGYQQYDMSGNMNVSTTRMTKEEFNQCANIKSLIKNITVAAIIAYVVGFISLITNVILGGNVFGLLDVIIVVGLGVGIHMAKSRACSIVLLVYSFVNMIYMIILAGMPGGWLIIVCGIYATIYTFKYQNAWERYQQTGQL
ncbi:MAG: zinc-ribbon domain-containing protein [Eubacteriales bacterium]|nr:zinc-ribbon domain-containing protein [Eubacteriales bacterium]